MAIVRYSWLSIPSSIRGFSSTLPDSLQRRGHAAGGIKGHRVAHLWPDAAAAAAAGGLLREHAEELQGVGCHGVPRGGLKLCVLLLGLLCASRW